MPTLDELARAVEAVRHRGLMKRVDTSQPDVPKTVGHKGADWRPCAVCRNDARLILVELRS